MFVSFYARDITSADSVGGVRFDALRAAADPEIDLGGLEADHLQVEVEVHLGQALQLDREQVLVPASKLGEAVVGDHEGADLGLGEVLELEGRDRLHPELLRGANSAVAGDDRAACVDQDRVREPEGLDRLSNLADLFFAVRSRVAAAQSERRDQPLLDLKVLKS